MDGFFLVKKLAVCLSLLWCSIGYHGLCKHASLLCDTFLILVWNKKNKFGSRHINRLLGIRPLPFMLVISSDVYKGTVLCEPYPKE
jgi:hypothetical protein